MLLRLLLYHAARWQSAPLLPFLWFPPPTHSHFTQWSPSPGSQRSLKSPCCCALSGWERDGWWWWWGGAIKKKKSFPKAPGPPSQHSHVKWQLPQPIPPFGGEGEKCRLQKKRPTPTLVPTHSFNVPTPLHCSFPIQSVQQSPQARRKATNYCETSQIIFHLTCSHCNSCSKRKNKM